MGAGDKLITVLIGTITIGTSSITNPVFQILKEGSAYYVMPLSDPDADYKSVTSDIYGNIEVGSIDMNDNFINEAVTRISSIYPGYNFQNGGSGEKPTDLVVSRKITS